MIIKSPLNYSGSKNYIVNQLLEYIPTDLEYFIDAMGGAFNVGCNVKCAQNIVYNEINPFVFEIITMLLKEDPYKIILNINQIINYFNLSSGDKEAYLKLRSYYNKNKKPILLFVLHMFCFQNQLRFNNRHDFNTPVGNGSFNNSTIDRILAFGNLKQNIKVKQGDYNQLIIEEYPKNSLFYFDPPYLITNATYNDGKRGFKGWDIAQEKELLIFLDKINLNGQKFLLSNVIKHNGKTNQILLEWVTKNKYNVIRLKPHNGRYGAREEVLIKNY